MTCALSACAALCSAFSFGSGFFFLLLVVVLVLVVVFLGSATAGSGLLTTRFIAKVPAPPPTTMATMATPRIVHHGIPEPAAGGGRALGVLGAEAAAATSLAAAAAVRSSVAKAAVADDAVEGAALLPSALRFAGERDCCGLGRRAGAGDRERRLLFMAAHQPSRQQPMDSARCGRSSRRRRQRQVKKDGTSASTITWGFHV